MDSLLLPFVCGTFKSNNNINNKKTFVNPKSDQQLVSRYSYAEAFTKIVGIMLKKGRQPKKLFGLLNDVSYFISGGKLENRVWSMWVMMLGCKEWTKISRDYVTMHKIAPLSK